MDLEVVDMVRIIQVQPGTPGVFGTGGGGGGGDNTAGGDGGGIMIFRYLT